MSNYTNFNRQENFNSIELSFLGNTIRTFSEYGMGFCTFTNQLQGLYDGYFYNDLLELCDTFIKENADEAKEDGNLVSLHRAKADLKLIVEKVQALPVINQEVANGLV
tara:strand:- start:12600 stop:12923 length:324 start_codon:yes stop_codon:yes gene_type:complete